MNKIMTVACLIVVLICAVINPVIAGNQAGLTAVSLQLNWKHQFEFAGYYAAKHKGYYQDVGLDVDIREYQGSIDIIDDVISGQATFGTYYSNIVDAYIKGKPVVMLANIFKSSPLVIISQPEIKSPIDLKGKLVMTADELEGGHFTPMFERYGVNLDDISFVPHTFEVRSFVEKKVHAMTAFTTNELYQLDQLGVDYNILNPALFGLSFYDGNLFTSKNLVAKKPDLVRRFRSASIKGWEYALAHSDEVIDLMLSEYSMMKQRDMLLYEAKETKKIILPNIHLLGSIEKSHVKTMAAVFAEASKLVGFSGDIDGLLFEENQLQNFSLTENEKAFLQKKGLIRYCVDPDWMPFEAIDEEGNLMGITAKIMPLVEKYLGVPTQMLVTRSWSESLEAAQTRRCDILSIATNTKKRREYLNFTQPYLFLSSVIATKDEQAFIDDLNQVMGKPLAVVRGYSFLETLKKRYPNIKLNEVGSITEGLRAVKNGQYYGFIDTIPAISYAIQEQQLFDVRISGKLNLQKQMGMAARNDEPELVEILNRLLKNIGQARIQQISNDGLRVKYIQKPDYTLVWQVAVVILGVLLLLLYRAYLLKLRNQDLEVLSYTDGLTQLFNRLKSEHILEIEINRANRYGAPISIILLDIDHFKSVNDDFGHDVGDKVLKVFAEILQQNTRESDSAGRWGGEEFLIICPGIDCSGAQQLAESLRAKIEDAEFPYINQCTASFGVASLAADENLRGLLKRADQALYGAKDQGRNRVVLSDCL